MDGAKSPEAVRSQRDRLRVEYDLGPGDFEAWWHVQNRRTLSGRAGLWVTATLFAAGGARVGWFISAELARNEAVRAVFAVVGAALGFGLAFLAVHLWLRAAAAEYTAHGAGAIQFGRHLLEVGPTGVAEVGPAGRHEHPWVAVEALIETRDHLFIAVSGGYAYVVPRRGLGEADEALRQALRVRR